LAVLYQKGKTTSDTHWTDGVMEFLQPWNGGGRRKLDVATNPALTMDLTDRAVSTTTIHQLTNKIPGC
jgi:hypothetical protein